MLYALDFDGVVVDSIDECLNTSYKALSYIQREGSKPLSKQPTEEQKALFLHWRGLVRPSRNFFALWEWILNFPEKKHSQETFEKFASTFDDSLLKFEDIFHHIRSETLKNNPEIFIRENPLFRDVKEVWNEIPQPLYIVSTKDVESITLILKAHKLNVHGIFGRGSGPKAQTLLNLAKSNSIAIEDTFFVDDNAQHAIDVKECGSQVGLALWGYGPFETFEGKRLHSFNEVLGFFQPNLEVENSKNRH